MRRKIWGFRAAALVLSTALALPLLEGVLQAEYALRQRFRPSLARVGGELGWLPAAGLTTRYDKAGYGEIRYSTNADGFRRFGDPRSGRPRIWAVGDSTTQAYQVSDGEAYYDVLAELEPGLELFGYGLGGYGTVQQAMVLERFWDRVRPDVVLWQMCANDWINNDPDLEAASNEHNNHMPRPYLGPDGRIELGHPDGRLGWLARRSLLVRRVVVVRSSLRKRTRGSIESRLDLDHPGLRRSIETTRQVVERRIMAAPETTFLAFFVPSPEGYEWEEAAWRELCQLPRLHCLPEVHRAVEAARRAGETVDGGADPHWNARGHEIAARAIHERLRALPRLNRAGG